MSANAEARQVFELMGNDLRSAIIRSNGKPWIHIETETVGDSSDVAKMYFFSPVLVRLRKYDSNEDGVIDEQ